MLLKKRMPFVSIVLLAIFCPLFALYSIDPDVVSLQNTLKTIYISYQNAESKISPPAGYIISIFYDKNLGTFTGRLQERGSRPLGKPIEMPMVRDCPFCYQANSLQVTDEAINERLADQQLTLSRSLRDRILIIPSQHVGNWFEMGEGDLPSLIEHQQNVVCATIEFCRYVEAYFPEKLTTNEAYQFEVHLGSAGKQAVPHIHFRVESGSSRGCLNEEEWAAISSCQ